MPAFDSLVADFLAQHRIAVVGVSRKSASAANSNFAKFKRAGYQVYAVNPNAETVEGERCYPDLKSLPEAVDAVLICTNAARAEAVVRECIDLGVRRVWMHCATGSRAVLMGKPGPQGGSASPEAVRLAREAGLSVIAGGCPHMFLEADFAHACMRGLLRLTGGLAV